MARTTRTRTKLEHVHFDSVAEMSSDVHGTYSYPYNQSLVDRYIRSTESRSNWHGVDGGAVQCVRMATVDGYPAGEDRLRAFHEDVAAKLPRALGFMRTKHRGEHGDEVDVHAMLRGAHDKAWTRSTRAIRAGSGILRLCVDIGGNAHQSASALQWRGLAGAAMAEVMRKAGYSVEIVACFAVSNPSDKSGFGNAAVSCVVKPRTALIDFGQLAATVCLPAFFRTLGFAALVRACDRAGAVADSGLGQYLAVSGVLPVDPKVTTLFVSPDVMNRDSAVDWVRQSVALLQGARA